MTGVFVGYNYRRGFAKGCESCAAKVSAALSSSPGRLDRVVQLMLRRPQVLFRLGAVPGHVVMVGGASSFHLMNRFLYMVMHRFQIVPVTLSNRDSRSEREAHR